MASAPGRLKTVLRETFNPLQLLKAKEPIVPSMGHSFNEELRCSRCDCEWIVHRQEPRDCGSENKAPGTPEEEDPLVA